MRIISFIKTTSGGRHAWYEAEQRGQIFKIRKPLGIVDLYQPPEKEKLPEQVKSTIYKDLTNTYVPARARRTIWQRFIDWIKRKVGKNDTI